MINTVIKGAFKDYVLKLNCDWDNLLRLEFGGHETFFLRCDGRGRASENSLVSWNFLQQKTPTQYIIEINWSADGVIKNCEAYRIFISDGTKSTIVIDDKIFSFFNKYFFDRRTDLSEEEKQAILNEVRKQQTIEAMTRPAEKPAPVEHEPVSDNTPRCPTCGSTNIRKIDGLERGTSVLMLGLFSKKINKTFKCKNCGHTW